MLVEIEDIIEINLESALAAYKDKERESGSDPDDIAGEALERLLSKVDNLRSPSSWKCADIEKIVLDGIHLVKRLLVCYTGQMPMNCSSSGAWRESCGQAASKSIRSRHPLRISIQKWYDWADLGWIKQKRTFGNRKISHEKWWTTKWNHLNVSWKFLMTVPWTMSLPMIVHLLWELVLLIFIHRFPLPKKISNRLWNRISSNMYCF